MSIETIQNLGDDALANLFSMTIADVTGVAELTGDTVLRAQNFNVPGTGANTYEVHYLTQKMTKVGGKINAPNEFSFDFRVDRNWELYKGFKTWKNLVADSLTGVTMSDTDSTNVLRVPITVWPTGSDGTKISEADGWLFKGCFVQNLGDIGFDYSNGDPIIISVTIGFAVLSDTPTIV